MVAGILRRLVLRIVQHFKAFCRCQRCPFSFTHHSFQEIIMLTLVNFGNTCSSNIAHFVIDHSGTHVYYEKICNTGIVNAGRDHEGKYWASWTPDGEACPTDYVTECACLDDALSDLEIELKHETFLTAKSIKIPIDIIFADRSAWASASK
jgi:hypothetical protein